MPLFYLTTTGEPPDGGRVPGPPPVQTMTAESAGDHLVTPSCCVSSCIPSTSLCPASTCQNPASATTHQPSSLCNTSSGCSCCEPICCCSHCSGYFTFNATSPALSQIVGDSAECYRYLPPGPRYIGRSITRAPSHSERNIFPEPTLLSERHSLLSPPMTSIHILSWGFLPWLSSNRGSTFTFKAYSVPPSITVNDLIELVFGERHQGTYDRNERVVVECHEVGDGRWTKASVWKYGEHDASQTLAMIGWTASRGQIRKPVWIAWKDGGLSPEEE